MSYWQQDNCMRCAKAVWYNTQLGRCPKYKCALQRDMEAQATGDMEINERSFNACHNAKTCPFIKPKEQESAPGDEILDFSKGESMSNETTVFNKIEQAPEIEHGHEEKPMAASEHKPTPEELKAAEKRMYDTIFEKEIMNNINGLSPMMTEKQFKESVRHDTDWMMKTFTFNENMMIAFVPLVISHLAWVYAEKVMKYCAEHKIPETVKLSRAVKHVRQEYVDSLKRIWMQGTSSI